MFSVLRNRNFLFLWSGQVFSQLADRMLVGVLLLNVHYLTKNNLAMSLPMLSFGLSAIIFGTIAGVFVDRWSKKRIMVLSNILRAILLIGFVFLTEFRESLLVIFLASFLIFTIAQFFSPAEAACIPAIVEKNKLLGANSFFMGTWMSATVIGFGFISLLSFFGVSLHYMYVIAACFYMFAAILVSFLKLQEVPLTRIHTIQSTLKDFTFGFYYSIKKRIIKYSIIKVFIASCVLAVLSELAINFVYKVLGQGRESFGFFVAFSGVGMGASILTLPYLKSFLNKYLTLIGFTICGAMLVLMNCTTNPYLILIIIFFLGFGNGYITIPIQTVLQENVPARMRGRVFGLQNVMISGAFTLPVILAGYLADIYSVGSVFMGMGILVLISIVLVEGRLLLAPIKINK